MSAILHDGVTVRTKNQNSRPPTLYMYQGIIGFFIEFLSCGFL